jgi:hypothetical protein
MMLMNAHTEKKMEWMERYYAPLVGAKILGIKVVPDEFDAWEAWLQIEIEHADGTRSTLEVSKDEEGNGGGFLFGLPLPEVVTA